MVWDICTPYWRAFSTLSGSRTYISGGMGAVPGPIPYMDKAAYARDHGFLEDEDEFALFLYLLGQMDSAYLAHAAERK